MLLNEYLNRFREGIQKIENYGYADSVDIREEVRANKQAILNVKVVLINQSVLHIKEYLDAKYRINSIVAKAQDAVSPRRPRVTL